MADLLLYIGCGLTAGLLGGYLGLGGGIIMVPYLTLVAGTDILTAVPVSVTAIVVNSIASSTEYLRKGMVDLEISLILAVFMTMGNIFGSKLSETVSTEFIQLVFTALLLYTSVVFIRGRKPKERIRFADNRKKYLPLCILLIFLTGMLAGLVGIGGGIILIPIMFLIIGLPLTTARGTSSFMIGFSAAASAAVYFLNGRLDTRIALPVVLGILVGGKLGGYFGTVAKPLVIRIVFFLLMLYLAIRIGYEPLRGLL